MVLTLDQIKNVLIIGSGTMGLRIGLQSAMSGYQVTLYDTEEKSLERALHVQDKLLKELIRKERIDDSEADEVKNRIRCTTDPKDAAKDTDLVSESVFEDVEVKEKLYHQFSPLFPEHAVVTTNTSYFLPSMFAPFVAHPDRFCAFHFHDVLYSNVVDVMPHPDTSPWVVDLLVDFGKTINQIPIVVKKESPGYLFNAMLMAFLGAAGWLVSNEIGNPHDVDKAWMGNTKMSIGPFGMMDGIGLDTTWHVVKNRSDRKSQQFAAMIKTYVDAGKLGLKSGEGFYKYPNPAYKNEDFLS